MKLVKLFVISFLVIVIGFLLFRMFAKEKKMKETFVRAEYKNIEKTLTISGIIVPEKEIEIKSTISGVLEKMSVHVGDVVQMGNPIASVHYVKDPMDYKRLMEQLEVTQAKLENAELRFKGTQDLFDQKLVAKEEYENEKNEVSILRMEYRALESELSMLRGYFHKKEISNIITSTGNGTILELPVKEGGSVMARGTLSEGTTIAKLADMNSLVFKGEVLESDILSLKVGMPMKFSLSADEDIRLTGRIEVISPKGILRDGISRFEITASIDLSPAIRKYIKAGYTANGTTVIKRKIKVLALEEKYFQFSYDSVYVEVRKLDGTTEKKFLKTGISDGTYTEILKGISAKEKIMNKYKKEK